MKVPIRSLLTLRNASNAVSSIEKASPATLSSDFFEHIRHQVYGDSKKVDKVVVTVPTEDEPRTVLVNRDVSTAFHCFNHINKQFADDAVLVEVIPSVGGSYFASVNQPIQDQATVRKIAFDSAEHSGLINESYWRSCSFATAAFLKDALDVDIDFDFPENDVKNSFFSVTVKGLDGNSFSPDELSTINRFGKSFIRDEKLFEVISVPQTIADENGISGSSLVRLNQHVFSANGPVIRSTSQIGRFSVFRSKPSGKDVIVGGVSLPTKQPTSSYSWSLIAKNAANKFSKPV